MINNIEETFMTTPYFYIIKHKQSGLSYVGSRWAKGCNPNEFLKRDGYNTSSKIIHKLLKENSDCFEIISIIADIVNVKEFETKFIEDNKCVTSELWLNGHDNKTTFSHDDPKFKAIMIKLYGVDHWAKTEEGRNFHRKQMIALNNTPEFQARLLERNIKNNPALKHENRIKHSKSMKATNERMLSDGTHPMLKACSERMKVTMANQKELTCPHCNLVSKSKSNMNRWHFDNCKLKI
jgi:hypothetical protein